MLDHNYFLLIYMAVVVLLPLVPAFVTFKLLRSRATAEGPFKGLKIGLGGSFAAYFVVLLLLLGVFHIPQPLPSDDQVWQVTGTVHLRDQEGVPFATVRLSPIPPPVRVRSDGSFAIKVFVSMSDGGNVNLPDLLLEAPGYMTQQESLDNSLRSMKDHTVNITKPIELRREPNQPYKSAKPLQPDEVSRE